MKTMENTEDVSLPPAQLAGWGLKIGEDEAHVTEKSHFRTVKKLAKSCTGRQIAGTTRKTQFDAMNHKSNGKSRLKGQPMNYTRIGLAAVGGFVAYFALGGLIFGLLPSL